MDSEKKNIKCIITELFIYLYIIRYIIFLSDKKSYLFIFPTYIIYIFILSCYY